MKTFPSLRGITPDSVRSRHIDSIFEDKRRRLFGSHTIQQEHELNIPNANITEENEEKRTGYLIELAAPGYDKGDFDINVNGDYLIISGQLTDDRIRDEASFTRREHNFNAFSRAWSLPESCDEENITAKYRNGILEVFIPVIKPLEQTNTPRRIPVGS
ncbi:Hsp20/alpha crystallin family protein [Neolewinella persica]|uniref:Hsp20/alpha crystallin family protein n=1 Tax=Neolewinella persica TaxID=70998 RepID=UPI0003734D18|nr:Hsp20/alpha crystallin family protein [Neolewinella persica]